MFLPNREVCSGQTRVTNGQRECIFDRIQLSSANVRICAAIPSAILLPGPWLMYIKNNIGPMHLLIVGLPRARQLTAMYVR